MSEATAALLALLTEADLIEAYALCRGKSWQDYPHEMGDATRRALVEACALGRKRKAMRVATRPVCAYAPAAGALLAQQPLLSHWPPRRAAMPAAFDRKRAAAGDRDD